MRWNITIKIGVKRAKNLNLRWWNEEKKKWIDMSK